jgi:hypothetical protein
MTSANEFGEHPEAGSIGEGVLGDLAKFPGRSCNQRSLLPAPERHICFLHDTL